MSSVSTYLSKVKQKWVLISEFIQYFYSSHRIPPAHKSTIEWKYFIFTEGFNLDNLLTACKHPNLHRADIMKTVTSVYTRYQHYLYIPHYTGSWGNRFQETLSINNLLGFPNISKIRVFCVTRTSKGNVLYFLYLPPQDVWGEWTCLKKFSRSPHEFLCSTQKTQTSKIFIYINHRNNVNIQNFTIYWRKVGSKYIKKEWTLPEADNHQPLSMISFVFNLRHIDFYCVFKMEVES